VIDELYDLIGGRRTVWAATETFYKRIFADDTLRPFFETTDMAQLCARQSMFISMLLGGRVVYTGKDIHDAHAHAREQGLNDGHFDRFLAHFRESLFTARNVALVGATDREGSVGRIVVRNLLEWSYRGQVFLINPRRAELFARRCCAAITDVPDAVERCESRDAGGYCAGQAQRSRPAVSITPYRPRLLPLNWGGSPRSSSDQVLFGRNAGRSYVMTFLEKTMPAEVTHAT
jgi:hemoglobin